MRYFEAVFHRSRPSVTDPSSHCIGGVGRVAAITSVCINPSEKPTCKNQWIARTIRQTEGHLRYVGPAMGVEGIAHTHTISPSNVAKPGSTICCSTENLRAADVNGWLFPTTLRQDDGVLPRLRRIREFDQNIARGGEIDAVSYASGNLVEKRSPARGRLGAQCQHLVHEQDR